MINFKGSQFERDIILWGIRWYVAYSINYRQLEEVTQERGVSVDHSSLNRWVLKYTQLLDQSLPAMQASGGCLPLLQQPATHPPHTGKIEVCYEQ